jgi:hypothetical protein
MENKTESVDLLNYWAIALLERLGNHHPSQGQIDLVALLLFASANAEAGMPWLAHTYH